MVCLLPTKIMGTKPSSIGSFSRDASGTDDVSWIRTAERERKFHLVCGDGAFAKPAESQECMAAKLGSQAVAVRAGIEREQLETGVQACAAFRPTRRVTISVKVKARRETVNPSNIVARNEVVVKKREILGHCLNCDFWDLGDGL